MGEKCWKYIYIYIYMPKDEVTLTKFERLSRLPNALHRAKNGKSYSIIFIYSK